MSFFIDNINYLVPNFNEVFAFGIFIILIFSFFLTGYLTTGLKIFSPYNFGVGIFYFVLFFLSLSFFIHLNFILYLYLIFFSILFFKKFKKINIINNFKLKKYNQQFLLIIFFTFFIFLSAKPHGWDTFSFWLPRLNYILDNKAFPSLGFFRADYPYSFELINFSVLHILGTRVENIPSLLDCLIVILIFFVLIDHLKKKTKDLSIIFFILIFLNPLIIHTNTFSSYQDLKLAFVIFLIVTYVYKKKIFLIKDVKLKDIFILSCFNSILCVTKNIGIVYFSIISIFFLIINFYYLKFKLFELNNLKKISIYIVISLSLYILWYINVDIKDLVSSPEFKGFRLEILSEFYYNFIKQLLVRKIYFIGLIVLLLLFVSSFILKEFKHLRVYLALIVFVIVLWKSFLILFALSFQNYNHAINAHNYWRYFSHLGPIIFFGIFIFALEFQKYLNVIKINFFVCLFIFTISTVILFDKVRRDLVSPNYQLISVLKEINYLNFDTEKKIYFNSVRDRAYQKEIIRYYLTINSGKNYRVRDIISGQKHNAKDYQIEIFKNEVKFILN
jgi:hypothetical protein